MSFLARLAAIYVPLVLLETSFAAPIKIGVSAPLTGEGAAWGEDLRDILTFASEKLAPKQYQLIFEDDRCQAKDAISVAHKFASIDHVRYVTGFICSSSIMSTAKVYSQAKIVTMVLAASSPKVADLGDYVFRSWTSDELAAKELFKLVEKRGFKSVGVLSALTDYPQDFKESFMAAAKGRGIKVVSEDYQAQSSDLRPNILRLKAENPEALFLNSQFEGDFNLALRQVRELRWNAKLIAAYWPSSESVLDRGAKDIEGIEYVDPPGLKDVLNSEGAKLYAEYSARYGKIRSIDMIFASVFEGFRALHLAIQSGEDVRNYLYRTQFNGLIGLYSFDQRGEIQGFSFVLKKIQNGRPVVITP